MVTPTAVRAMQATRARMFQSSFRRNAGSVHLNAAPPVNRPSLNACSHSRDFTDRHVADTSIEKTEYRSISGYSRSTMARDNGGRLVEAHASVLFERSFGARLDSEARGQLYLRPHGALQHDAMSTCATERVHTRLDRVLVGPSSVA